MTINRGRILTFTGVAVLLYIFFGIAFDDQFFFRDGSLPSEEQRQFWFGDDRSQWFDGVWLRWLGLIVIIAAGILKAMSLEDEEHEVHPARVTDTEGQVDDPGFWKLLTGNIHFAILWLPLRFYLGIHWLEAGWHKVTSDAWMDGGVALQGYLTGATTPNPETGATRVTINWYEDFLRYMIDNEWYTWFGPFVAVGEVMVGLGMLFGALVGIASFFGTVMNMSFLLAGTVSSNPVMFGLTIFIILGWKVAGHMGLDRWLLPLLGTPWARRDATTTVPEDSYSARV